MSKRVFGFSFWPAPYAKGGQKAESKRGLSRLPNWQEPNGQSVGIYYAPKTRPRELSTPNAFAGPLIRTYIILSNFGMSIRLLYTETLRLKSFIGDAIPKYAVLSHTWIEGDEVSFQEMMAIAEYPDHPAVKKSGYNKIVECCQKARSHDYLYAWIDTCCIDKTSSAELSEAINSMYNWYQKASTCYVYLSDVPAGQDLSATDSKFRDSRWFTRGWTLQELLAPSRLIFYNQNWGIIGEELKHPSSKAGSG
ncbi:hypothetical protein B7463_g11936, partial [Scytalidium lignicola]